MGKERLLSEVEIDFLATCTPGEWCRIATQDWSMLASVIATARAYHIQKAECDRLRGLVEAIGAMQPRREWQALGGECVRVTCGHCLRMIADCRNMLSELDGGEAKQETKTGGTKS